MIPCVLSEEPEGFDERCRQRGRTWLQQHSGYPGQPEDYWREFQPALHDAFKGLCAYCAMITMNGEVDHFLPIALLKETGQDELAYEWSNFRYSQDSLNRRKWRHRILDPCDVRPGWFEISLPSLQLSATDQVPPQYRDLANFTIKKLGLCDEEVVLRYRRKWFELYCQRKLQLEGLREVAPLIAEAVERDLQAGRDWRIQGVAT